ncbi:MAG: hypothetical protein LBP35_02855 [Candidatus Ancillula trichonymphae]|nr:hypothetical protein [Candidatus Ancillula trichonymphae]
MTNYITAFDGEWILDMPYYSYNSSSDASVQVAQGSTSKSQNPRANFSRSYSDNAKNYLVFFELVDMDSDTKTTPDDTAVMAIVDDISDNTTYEPNFSSCK